MCYYPEQIGEVLTWGLHSKTRGMSHESSHHCDLCVWAWSDLRKSGLTIAVVVLTLLSQLPAFSQSGVGTIQGTVFDQTGAAVAGASVTVVDVARGISRPVCYRDSAGEYVALNPASRNLHGSAERLEAFRSSSMPTLWSRSA